MAQISKPTIGQPGWGDEVHEVIDRVNQLDGLVPDAKANAAGLAINAADYGVTSAATDNGPAWQAAIDAAQGMSTGSGGYPTIRLPAGELAIQTPITWKSAAIEGDAVGTGTTVRWDGTAGATVITKWTTNHPGKLSYARLSNIRFAPGVNEPATWLDLRAYIVDKFCTLDNLHFDGCSGDAIRISSWINLHWQNMRWDHTRGYCINATVDTTQPYGGDGFNASFLIDGYTVDNKQWAFPGGPSVGTSGPGVMLVDNTQAKLTNLGIICWANGRIEQNTPWVAPAGLFVYRNLSGTAAARSMRLHVLNTVYTVASGISTIPDCVFYRDTGGTAIGSGEELMLTAWRSANGPAKLYAGNWQTSVGDPWEGNTRRAYGFLALNCGPDTDLGGSSIGLYPNSNQTAQRIRRAGETADRFTVSDVGRVGWGNGSAATDVALYRASANVVATDGAFKTGASTTAARPSAVTLGAGATWWDTTLSRPIWSNGSVWVDSSGSTV